MNIKIFKNIAIVGLAVVLTFVFYKVGFDSNSKKEEKKDKTTVNYQTIVLRSKDDVLVPIEVDMKINEEDEQVYRNMLYLMQSNEYKDLGLYPLFASELEINSMDITDKTLTIDFNDNLYVRDNKEALDILEALAYTFCDDKIDNINLKIDGKKIAYLPNSTIPTSCLNKDLGINNFESNTVNIYRTVPVIVYNKKVINDHSYYVPVTTRLDVDDSDINSKVSLLLDEVDYDKPIKLLDNTTLDNGVLKVNIDSNILLGNETIDSTLYHQLVLSLSSIEGVKEVTILVDNQEIVPTNDVSKEINNRVKM